MAYSIMQVMLSGWMVQFQKAEAKLMASLNQESALKLFLDQQKKVWFESHPQWTPILKREEEMQKQEEEEKQKQQEEEEEEEAEVKEEEHAWEEKEEQEEEDMEVEDAQPSSPVLAQAQQQAEEPPVTPVQQLLEFLADLGLIKPSYQGRVLDHFMEGVTSSPFQTWLNSQKRHIQGALGQPLHLRIRVPGLQPLDSEDSEEEEEEEEPQNLKVSELIFAVGHSKTIDPEHLSNTRAEDFKEEFLTIGQLSLYEAAVTMVKLGNKFPIILNAQNRMYKRPDEGELVQKGLSKVKIIQDNHPDLKGLPGAGGKVHHALLSAGRSRVLYKRPQGGSEMAVRYRSVNQTTKKYIISIGAQR